MHHPAGLDRHNSVSSVTSRPRKVATGGNRSWSEEEVSLRTVTVIGLDTNCQQENYLLQTRMQKMPYKHIAAHLKKTELACRLHYHQLSHGSHRRKRTNSTASSNSSASSRQSGPQYPLPGQGTAGIHTPMQGSPNGYSSMSPGGYSGLNHSPGRVHHKVLLPKPRTLTPDDSPNRLHGLRINTATGATTMQHSPPDDRLHNMYNPHRPAFWSAPAVDYPHELPTAHVQDMWRHDPANMMRRPPTPGDSPNSRATHQMLKPSPFLPYPTPGNSAVEPSKDYSPVNHVSAMPPTYHHQMTPPQPNVYDPIPHQMPRIDRQPSWSNPHSGVPATAITALLTEDKCPRHQQYCIGGRCFSTH